MGHIHTEFVIATPLMNDRRGGMHGLAFGLVFILFGLARREGRQALDYGI